MNKIKNGTYGIKDLEGHYTNKIMHELKLRAGLTANGTMEKVHELYGFVHEKMRI